jgi:hypothetical protein
LACKKCDVKRRERIALFAVKPLPAGKYLTWPGRGCIQGDG